MKCGLCPRQCSVDRRKGEKGICGQTDEIKVARAALHMWEEPCISGIKGSGAVFFCGCALHCVFCQNDRIANGTVGKIITQEHLAEIFLELQEKGANNINLVTAGQFVPQVIPALKSAKEQGLFIPVVYNTSSYENADTIKSLAGLVDIYLPDFKYVDSGLAKKYSHAPDYFRVASEAVREMVCQVGEPVFYTPGSGQQYDSAAYNEICDGEKELLMRRGVIARHLLLPGCEKDSREVLSYLINTYGKRIYISIMNQFTPPSKCGEYPELQHKITASDYEKMIDFALDLGIENAFIQEGETAQESFIPDFDGEGV